VLGRHLFGVLAPDNEAQHQRRRCLDASWISNVHLAFLLGLSGKCCRTDQKARRSPATGATKFQPVRTMSLHRHRSPAADRAVGHSSDRQHDISRPVAEALKVLSPCTSVIQADRLDRLPDHSRHAGAMSYGRLPARRSTCHPAHAAIPGPATARALLFVRQSAQPRLSPSQGAALHSRASSDGSTTEHPTASATHRSAQRHAEAAIRQCQPHSVSAFLISRARVKAHATAPCFQVKTRRKARHSPLANNPNLAANLHPKLESHREFLCPELKPSAYEGEGGGPSSQESRDWQLRCRTMLVRSEYPILFSHAPCALSCRQDESGRLCHAVDLDVSVRAGERRGFRGLAGDD